MDEFAISPEGELMSWQRRDPVWCPRVSVAAGILEVQQNAAPAAR